MQKKVEEGGEREGGRGKEKERGGRKQKERRKTKRGRGGGEMEDPSAENAELPKAGSQVKNL